MIQNRKTFSWCWQSPSENPQVLNYLHTHTRIQSSFHTIGLLPSILLRYRLWFRWLAIIGKRRRINYCNHYLHQSCCITCVLSRIGQQIHRFVTLCANENVVIKKYYFSHIIQQLIS
jgi:hypothetical protein